MITLELALTIVQQLIRTLFIQDLSKTKRRKLIEISLAPWMTSVFTKEAILDIYISSVRFERKCFGVISAMEYFWGVHVERPTKAQSFFLVERVSNVRSKLLVNKIIETAKSAKKQGLMSESDLISLAKIYEKAVQDKKIIASQEDLLRLTQQIST